MSNTHTQLESYVQEYVEQFTPAIQDFETYKKGYKSNVLNRSTEVVYSKMRPENFVDKCNATSRELENYGVVLTKHIFIKSEHINSNRFYNDLFTLFELGYRVHESNTQYVQLKRPESLFKDLEQTIESQYQIYKESTVEAHRQAYFHIDEVNKYVTMREEEERSRAIIAKQSSIEAMLDKVKNSGGVDELIKEYLADKEEITLKALRAELGLKKDVSDKLISDILKLNKWEQVKTSSGNVWRS